MSSDWPVCRISDVAEVVGGGTPSSKVEEYYGGDIPWITPKDLSSHREMYISAGGRNITGLGLSKSSAKMLPIDTVLLTSRAPIGYVAIAKTEVSTNQGFKSLILKEGNDPVFFYYLLKFNVPLFESRATGSTFKEISGQVLKDTELRIPDYETQKAIGEKLRSLDKKIELNSKINQTLEQMAQAIFKSWFVDFEPVKAKIAALEAGGSEDDALLAAMQAIAGSTLFATDTADADAQTQLARLQTEHPEQYATLRATAELFPSAMQESELGEIPEGWNAGQLSDIAMFTSNRISVEELSVETYISTENMLENKAGIRNAASLPSAATVIKFEPLHILVSNIRPYFKKIWLANFNGGRSADVLGFESKHQGTSEFLYNLLYQDQFFDYMMLTSKGAKMPRGDKDAIMQFAIAVPPVELMKYFSQRVEAFYNLINMNRSGGRSLSELRDTLLPKLLSGEIDVSALADNTEVNA